MLSDHSNFFFLRLRVHIAISSGAGLCPGVELSMGFCVDVGVCLLRHQ